MVACRVSRCSRRERYRSGRGLGQHHRIYAQVRPWVMCLRQTETELTFVPSSLDYQRELAGMLNPRASQMLPAPAHPQRPVSPRQTTSSSTGRSSDSASTSSFKIFGSSHKPDPDREDSVWHEPESYSAVVTRKDHPRDPTALSSLREVLRHKVPVEGAMAAQPSAFTSVSRMAINGAPPCAWAKPAVEVNMAAVDGRVTGMPEAVITAGRILHELDGASVPSSKGSIDSSSSAFVETNVHRGKTSSVLPRTSAESLGTNSHAHATPEGVLVPTPHWAAADRGASHTELLVDPRSRSSTASTMLDSTDTGTHDGSLFSWTSSLTNAMRYVLKSEHLTRPPTPAAKNHHGLLYADPLAIDERPHIRYDWTIGKRLKFSCTVYYAKQFDALRRRCGVEDVFTKSMAKCERWKAQGGKSRSNFWKTSDDRFIVKTLVNAWNVADLYVAAFFCSFLKRERPLWIDTPIPR
jgi:1-phosphatidylinositol-3-phosphate 5-kinase